MENKEKIIQILTDNINHCYCDNCKYDDYETYGDDFCDGCYRKYSNWALSSLAAEKIVDEIVQFGEIYPVSKEEIKGDIKNEE